MARALEVPLYHLFYDGEEPPKLPNLLKRKNAQDEWQSKTDWHRVVLWNNRVAFAERLHAGDHILVGGTLVSSNYERVIGKGKKAATLKLTSWSIRANVVRKLNRAEKEPEAVSAASGDRPTAAKIQSSTDAPF